MSKWKIVVPEATTNFCTNPSFENNLTTGWAKVGANTIDAVTTKSKFGLYSLLATYQDQLELANFTLTLTVGTHATSCWVFIDPAWDGGLIAVSADDTTFGDVVGKGTATSTTTTGEWVRIESFFDPTGPDLTGTIRITASSAPTAGSFIYIDAFQCEKTGTYSTTYTDGDQEGCEWTGAEHASTSTRETLSRAGGRVRDLEDTYSLAVERMVGTGVAAMENVLTDRVFTPGANFEGRIVLPRVFALVSTVRGSSLANYHALRQAFFNDIVPDALNDEPIIFRYTGAAVDKEIRARYSGGMTMVGPSGFAENVALQFVADDPFFTQIGETSGGAVATNASATFRLVAGRIDGVWNVLGPPAVPGTAVYTDAEVLATGADGTLYIAGDFTNFDNDANADFIVSYDGSSYSALGSGMDDVVHALLIKPDGNLLAGGSFTTAGGTTVRGIAEWNGSAWSALGPPSSGGIVLDIGIAPDGTIYVVGDFDNWDGTANADNIASWDGTNWSAVGTGVPTGSYINAIVVDTNGDVYIGGNFTTAGGQTTDNVAKWDGTTWSVMSAGSTNGDVNDLHLADSGELIAGGVFTTIDGVSANRIATWNGASWSAFGTGAGGTVWRIAEWREFIVVAGAFTTVGGIDVAAGFALWNGSSWSHLDFDAPGGGSKAISGLAVYGDDLYLGFDQTGTGTHSGTTSITPGGNTRVYPIIEIDRSGGTAASLLNIINETTNRYLWLNLGLQDGEKITFDTRPGQSSIVSSFHGAIAPAFQPSNLSQFYLLPNVANDIKAFITVAGAPTITSTIKWVESYWSID